MKHTEKLVIIGNKPYYNLRLNSILDSFDRNVRCNMSMPNINNGTKCDGWAMCDHVYDNIVRNPLTEEGLVNRYKTNYDVDKVREFYRNKPPTTDYSFFLEPHSMDVFRHRNWNIILEQLGCPYKFTKDPRMGYLVMLWALQRDTKIYLSNWSITDEVRVTYYIKPHQPSARHLKTPTPYEVPGHDAKSEVAILRWLHEHNHVDASLCLLEDKIEHTFIEDKLQPTEFIVNKLKQHI